jgi:SAM-dependent methyltransferase
MRLSRLGLAAVAGVLAAAWWWRTHPSACPYSQRLWVQAPHPLITRERLRRSLEPQRGERLLEIGPGTGYYTLDLAGWVGPEGAVEILDLQREMLDHTMRRAREGDVSNVVPTHGDATALPYEDDSIDGVVLVAVLGEIPDPDSAMREIARVLKPSGRLIVGEIAGDPHFTSTGALEGRGRDAGLRLTERSGPPFGYFARLVPV